MTLNVVAPAALHPSTTIYRLLLFIGNVTTARNRLVER